MQQLERVNIFQASNLMWEITAEDTERENYGIREQQQPTTRWNNKYTLLLLFVTSFSHSLKIDGKSLSQACWTVLFCRCRRRHRHALSLSFYLSLSLLCVCMCFESRMKFVFAAGMYIWLFACFSQSCEILAAHAYFHTSHSVLSSALLLSTRVLLLFFGLPICTLLMPSLYFTRSMCFRFAVFFLSAIQNRLSVKCGKILCANMDYGWHFPLDGTFRGKNKNAISKF